ncbi:hypothetical protein HDU85_006460 [Gaertneriomyces sp. JEL0708]|nr:hypothetical protein HDU85_006460 [Gaertneriomyces sp. JEL0708]
MAKEQVAEGKLPRVPSAEGQANQPAGLPIAARLKGPGPAAYCLPSTIGVEGKTMKRAPAYSFGTKLKYQHARETPGPNAFFPQATRKGISHGPAFSLQGPHKKGVDGMEDVDASNSPGPGKYNPPVLPSREAKAPAYSIGSRHHMERPSPNPGPGEYTIPPTLGPHTAVTKTSAAAYTIKPPRPFKLMSVSPGPAAYTTSANAKLKPTSPAYSLGSRWGTRGDDLLDPATTDVTAVDASTPGPGQYSPVLQHVKTSRPQYSFRTKHSEYALFVPDPVGGQYSL